MKTLPIVCALLAVTVAHANVGRAHYDVHYTDTAPDLDSAYSAEYWADVPEISSAFHYPWRDIAAPATSFRAVHDDDNLYMVFVADDPDIIVTDWVGERETVSKEDRVEVFFTPSPIDQVAGGNVPYYYALEIDPEGRTHDYRARYYRHLDSEWNLNGLKTSGERQDGQYTVRIQIPLDELKALNLIKDDNTIETGIFRAEFSRDDNTKGGIDQAWISWVNPNTPTPDFHVDSAFGQLRLLPSTK